MGRVSVIIPVYCAEQWVARCVRSVLAQTFDDFEAVCVDDGSRDGSQEALTALAREDARVRVVARPNGGLSLARNTGLAHTQGTLVYFLDVDDFIHPRLLEEAVGALEADTQAAFALFDTRKVPPDAPTSFEPLGPPTSRTTLHAPLRDFLRHYENPDVWRFVYRRSAIGALRFVPGLRYEDLDFTYRFLRRAKRGVRLHAVLHAYVQTPNSLLRHPLTEEDIRFYVWILRHLREDFAPAPHDWRLLRRRLFPHVLKAIWKRILRDKACEPRLATAWRETAALFRDGIVRRHDFSVKWQWRFWLLGRRFR